MRKLFQNNKTITYLFTALLVLGIWKFAYSVGIFLGKNPSSLLFPLGFASFWLALSFVLLFAYTRLDEYQKHLVRNALALSALLTITIKMPLIFFEYLDMTPSFDASWMTICLIFSFLIFLVVLFLKDDDSAISHEE